MNGNLIVGGIVAIALAAGVGLWYSQTYAYYEQQNGLEEVLVGGNSFDVSNYYGIDADTSPLKLRACFSVDWDYSLSKEFKDLAEPLTAPSWFDCFDAEIISKDIKAGNANVILAEKNIPFGFSRFIAQYPDGKAYMWRQINACGKAQFDGNDLPEGCSKEVSASDLTDVVEQKRDALKMFSKSNLRLKQIPFENEGVFLSNLGLTGLTWFNDKNPRDAMIIEEEVPFLGGRSIEPGMSRISAVFQDDRAAALNQKWAN